MGGRAAAWALSAACALLLAPPAPASVPEFVRRHVPEAEVVGQGRLVFLLWEFYDATLYAPGGRWEGDAPFALTLAYLREFTGEEIARASAREIGRLGSVAGERLASWRGRMERIFPDVGPGDRLTGVRDGAGRAVFYRGAEPIGTIDDPEFSRLFFGIWLDERTLASSLRADLLGTPGE